MNRIFLALSLVLIINCQPCWADANKKILPKHTHCPVNQRALNNSKTAVADGSIPTGWIADCGRRIRRVLPNGGRIFVNKTLSCYFKLNKAGGVAEAKVITSSGETLVDQSAIQAIKEAAVNFRPIASDVPYTIGLLAQFKGPLVIVRAANSPSQ
jgi:TonB family protein